MIDTVLGTAVLAACLIATVTFAVVLFRDLRRIIRFLMQAIAGAIRGEKTPRTQHREEVRQMRAKVISQEEAIARVREYAHANGRRFDEPWDIKLQHLKTAAGRKEEQPVERFIYSMVLGTSRPAPVVEVDAIDGTVLKWQTFPR